MVYGLAGFLLNAGCYTPFAVPLYRFCLAHGESVLGVEHPATLSCVNNVGDILHKRGEDPGAEALFRQVLGGNGCRGHRGTPRIRCPQSLRQKLGQVLGSLTGCEKRVFEMRFGLVDGQARTLEEVGRKLKAPQARLRQIEAKALRKLRHPTRLRLMRSL